MNTTVITSFNGYLHKLNTIYYNGHKAYTPCKVYTAHTCHSIRIDPSFIVGFVILRHVHYKTKLVIVKIRQ